MIIETEDTTGSRINDYLNRLVDRREFSGTVLIARSGGMQVKKGYGMADYEHNVPNRPHTLFRIASLTKPFTATAVMLLKEQGALKLSDPVSRFFPGFKPVKRFTIRHLLNHTAGVPNISDSADYSILLKLPCSRERLMERITARELDFKPGTQYNYSNSGYILLGHIIELVSKQAYGHFLWKNIFEPLQMTSTRLDYAHDVLPHRASGYWFEDGRLVNAGYINMEYSLSAGGLVSTVEDLFRWDRALYTDRILESSILDEMFTPGLGNYGLGWAAYEVLGRRVVAHSGGLNGFTSHLARFVDDGVCIIILCNFQHAEINRIGHDLAAILFG